jgi:hypothetical protein
MLASDQFWPKDAMRQRIRDIAASRDLSDEEIKPVLKLKHHEIAEFTEKHGVNLEWLLEGKGRIFEKDPIGLSPNMTGVSSLRWSGRCRWLISGRSEPCFRSLAGAQSVKRRSRSVRKRNRQRLASHARRLKR